MSKQIAWSFAQAFVADDELTSQGDSDFMKYGVSLAALVSVQSEGAAREWSTVVKISIPPPSFKPVPLSLSRSPLL